MTKPRLHHAPASGDGLKTRLDHLALRFGEGHLGSDPVRFARRYDAPSDREAAALLSALFAYGNVASMGAFLDGLLAGLGPSPARALKRRRPRAATAGYRFQTASDVEAVLEGVGGALAAHGSLEAAFAAEAGSPDKRLEAFALRLRRECGRPTRGVSHLLPLPSGGSACKRWRLFLRWVVRPDDGVDLGLWSCLSPADLVIPVDTHVARIARALGLVERATPDGSFARELTASLARLCPEDPTRYDFALAHLGIERDCRGRPVEALCLRCSLRSHCRLGG